MDPLVIIAGPTATGKSALAVRLAKKINGSIISCDSMQVYTGMDIGTAKISPEEREDIPHYLIDVLDPSEDFNIATFKSMANTAIKDIVASGRIPIMTGGTGFYIQSVLYDIDFEETDEDTTYRDYLHDLINDRGAEYVHSMLAEADPAAALAIHPNDHKRLIRALEYHKQTGLPISEHNIRSRKREAAYNACYFVMSDDRQRLYDRIDSRVDDMITAGLEDEVKKLLSDGLTRENVSMQGLGYKEMIDHLEGRITLEEAVYRIKRDSRHFAKRQLTWYRREKDVIWLDLDANEDVMPLIMTELEKKGIINERSV